MSDPDAPADGHGNADGRGDIEGGGAVATGSAVAGPARFAGQGGAAGAYVRQATVRDRPAVAPGVKPPPRRRGRGVSPWLVLLLLVIIAGLCFRLGYLSFGGGVFSPGAKPRPVAARGPLAEAERAGAEVFEAASPSVVHITGTVPAAVARDAAGRRGFQPGRQVAGSGFVWNDEGHVVTNAHVVADAADLRVTLANGNTYPARPVGSLTDRDIAVLKVLRAPPSEFTPILVGSSADLRVGQKAYAIGSPFGLNLTLTEGVVSGLDRKIEGAAEVLPGGEVTAPRITGAIQTDAAINRGNSGGPLLDSAGRLIGMTTAIFSQSEGSDGVGFAVPVDDVNRFVPDLIDDGRVGTVGLGVWLDDRSMRLRVGRGALPTPGAYVARVMPDTAAARAGVEDGDLIVAVDGTRVESGEDLRDLLTRRRDGGEVRLTVRRGDEEVELTANVQVLPDF